MAGGDGGVVRGLSRVSRRRGKHTGKYEREQENQRVYFQDRMVGGWNNYGGLLHTA